jgi:hypothetical protein
MAKLKFKKTIFGREAEVVDGDGDCVRFLFDIDDGYYFFTVNVKGEVVGVKRKQAVKLARTILKRASR